LRIQIHKPSGQRINYAVTAGGKKVGKNDVVKAREKAA
jgi:hypothetical protein